MLHYFYVPQLCYTTVISHNYATLLAVMSHSYATLLLCPTAMLHYCYVPQLCYTTVMSINKDEYKWKLNKAALRNSLQRKYEITMIYSVKTFFIRCYLLFLIVASLFTFSSHNNHFITFISYKNPSLPSLPIIIIF